jgi:DMATS type aromatic prenyltransferase
MNASPLNSAATLFDLTKDRLRQLAYATGLRKRAESIVALYAKLVDPWGHRPLGERPPWPSYVGDDQTPVEFSVTFAKKPELRILLEPLGRNPSLISNRDAALTLVRSLRGDFAIDLKRFDRIQDLYCPPDPCGAFSIWLAVGFSADQAPDFKIYLNPRCRGQSLAPALVEETLVRLGFPKAWPVIARRLLRRGPELDELNYLSLDLSPSHEARLKVYARHFACTIDDLEEVAGAARDHRPGDVREFLGLVAPRPGNDVLDGRAPCTCYTFVGGTDQPLAATTHFPINSYAETDSAVAQRVVSAFDRFGVSTDCYARAAMGFARRPLETGIGMHSYVSFRRYRDEVRFTTYLAVEAYRPGTVEGGGVTGESGIIHAARIEPTENVVDHPLCRRLAREPFSIASLAYLLANLEAADLGGGGATPVGSSAGVQVDSGTALRARLLEVFASMDSDGRDAGDLAVRTAAEDLRAFIIDLTERSVRGESTGRKAFAAATRAKLGPITTRELVSAWHGAEKARHIFARFLDDIYAELYGG